MKEATKEYGDWIIPPGNSIEDCFTEEKGMYIFWFNTLDNSTHIIIKRFNQNGLILI